MAKIEFYEQGADKHMAVVEDGAVPRVGEYISIRQETWRVNRVTWVVDHAADWQQTKDNASDGTSTSSEAVRVDRGSGYSSPALRDRPRAASLLAGHS